MASSLVANITISALDHNTQAALIATSFVASILSTTILTLFLFKLACVVPSCPQLPSCDWLVCECDCCLACRWCCFQYCRCCLCCRQYQKRMMEDIEKGERMLMEEDAEVKDDEAHKLEVEKLKKHKEKLKRDHERRMKVDELVEQNRLEEEKLREEEEKRRKAREEAKKK